MDYQKTLADFNSLLSEFVNKFNERDYLVIKNFVDYNELKIAVETMCEYLHEDQIVLSKKEKSKLLQICTLLEVDELYWSNF